MTRLAALAVLIVVLGFFVSRRGVRETAVWVEPYDDEGLFV